MFYLPKLNYIDVNYYLFVWYLQQKKKKKTNSFSSNMSLDLW